MKKMKSRLGIYDAGKIMFKFCESSSGCCPALLHEVKLMHQIARTNLAWNVDGIVSYQVYLVDFSMYQKGKQTALQRISLYI